MATETKPLRIAIQGIKGSNHDQVVQNIWGDGVERVECLSFDALVDALLNGEADRAVMAIENSIAGSIIPNYALVYQNNLRIVGEHYLKIQHNLMALEGQNIKTIKEVHSHPMALLQCKKFLRQYPHIKVVEDADTAETARRIRKTNSTGLAAIAPQIAAELYDLEILAPEIQTIKDNSTRFIILEIEDATIPTEGSTKASIRFMTEHKRGSLAAVLNVMSDCNLNMTKIQSLPIIETPWKYAFFVDVTFDTYTDFIKAKSLIEIMAENFTLLGTYKNGLE